VGISALQGGEDVKRQPFEGDEALTSSAAVYLDITSNAIETIKVGAISDGSTWLSLSSGLSWPW
jgi:hypothetical protein